MEGNGVVPTIAADVAVEWLVMVEYLLCMVEADMVCVASFLGRRQPPSRLHSALFLLTLVAAMTTIVLFSADDFV
jgi:hypothetical protein